MTLDINSIENIDLAHGFRADVMIASVTGEPRGWDVYERLSPRCASRWLVAQSSPNAKDEALAENIRARDSTAVVISPESIGEHIRTWLAGERNEPRSVLIDISCMSRPLMAQVFAALTHSSRKHTLIVTVAYSIAAYTPPPQHLPPNEDISPVSEAFAGWPSDPAATTTLIMGVGYEQDKAQGALEYFDPSDCWLFVPKSPITQYDDAVSQNNAHLIESVRRQHRVFDYSILDPANTFGMIVSVVSSMVGRSNPVILPFGPKIFFALSLIVASIYREVGVWHLTGDQMAGVPTCGASSYSVAFRLDLVPSETQ